VVLLADGTRWCAGTPSSRRRSAASRIATASCFVFRFNADGRFAHLTEHWNTRYARRALFDNSAVEPAHPQP
jgi:hypothetical protein